jgi:hypothetical protein
VLRSAQPHNVDALLGPKRYKLRCASPLASRLRARPVNRRGNKPRRKERAPVSSEDTIEQFADQQPRCEIAKAPTAEGECQRLGEVEFYGSLLCVAHAEVIRLGEHSEALLGQVFQMDQWLESVDGQADELRVRRAEHHRNELAEQLRFNRTRTGLIRDEFI